MPSRKTVSEMSGTPTFISIQMSSPQFLFGFKFSPWVNQSGCLRPSYMMGMGAMEPKINSGVHLLFYLCSVQGNHQHVNIDSYAML